MKFAGSPGENTSRRCESVERFVAPSACHGRIQVYPPPTKCTISNRSPGWTSVVIHFDRGRISRLRSMATRSAGNPRCKSRPATPSPTGTSRVSPFTTTRIPELISKPAQGQPGASLLSGTSIPRTENRRSRESQGSFRQRPPLAAGNSASPSGYHLLRAQAMNAFLSRSTNASTLGICNGFFRISSYAVRSREFTQGYLASEAMCLDSAGKHRVHHLVGDRRAIGGALPRLRLFSCQRRSPGFEFGNHFAVLLASRLVKLLSKSISLECWKLRSIAGAPSVNTRPVSYTTVSR